jgi:hypothetical protein
MSGKTGRGSPPTSTRFRKGESGNPKGRPRRQRSSSPSAFDIIIDRVLTVNQGGRARELTVDEALQHKAYQEALAGSRSARREVLKMIRRREKALAAQQPPSSPVEVLIEGPDPANANEALLILEIASPDPAPDDVQGKYQHLLLEPWAVRAALRRRRRVRLGEEDLSEIRRCTRDAASLHWPEPSDR